jgi:hypothetical protein
VDVPLTVTDRGDGLAASAWMTTLIYAPRSFPITTSQGRAFGAWQGASHWVRVNSRQQQPIMLRMTQSFVDSVTRKFGFGVQADLTPGFLGRFVAVVRPNVAWEQGQTATISADVPLPIRPGETWDYRFVRAKVFHFQEGFTHRYDRHGFRGLDDYRLVDFYSPPRELAEKIDYIDDIEAMQVE